MVCIVCFFVWREGGRDGGGEGGSDLRVLWGGGGKFKVTYYRMTNIPLCDVRVHNISI